MKRGLIARALACQTGITTILLGTLHASNQAVQVDRAVNIPEVWSPTQHVYTKGNLGVSAAKINALEQWIDQNAPNWTVVLVQDANREQFTEAGGRLHRGMDAVEFALGQTLPNKTAFGELKHPKTGEKNGAYFLLFLQERKLSYFASEAYDKRNLGENRWQGNLDSPAIRAMRGGGRVIDAAKDTIINIDRQLARKLANADAERKRAADREKRLQAEAGELIAAAKREITVADTRAADLAKDLGNPSGDLVRPKSVDWNRHLQEAITMLDGGRGAAAGSAAQAVRDSIAGYLGLLDAHRAAIQKLSALQARIEKTTLHELSSLAREQLQEAKTALEAAQDAHARADVSYSQQLDQAQTVLDQAVASSQFTTQQVARHATLSTRLESTSAHPNSPEAKKALAAAADALDTAQTSLVNGEHDVTEHLNQAESLLDESLGLSAARENRERRTRAAAITGGSVGGASLLLLGFIGNRRRRDEREVAETLLQTWDRTLKAKRDGLFALMDRATIIVGNVADVEERGYTGETLRLSKQTIKDVDELFIMYSCVVDIFDRAELLVRPTTLPAKGVNFIAATRYLRAVRLLRDEPVRFEAGAHLESIIKGKHAEATNLLGRAEDYEAFTMSFQDLVTAFDQRGARAVETLDLIEESWETIPDRLKALEGSIDQSEEAESTLRNQAALDQLFALRPVFDDLLPAAQQCHDRAAKLGTSDPVQALRGDAADGERMAGDGAALITLARFARSDLFPTLEQTCDALRSAGRKTQWVAASLTSFSERADELAREALESDAAEPTTALENDLAALQIASENALTLETQAAQAVLPSIEKTERLTADTRNSLAASLKLDPDSILRETDLDPTDKLFTAREEVASARAGLDRGAILAARSALTEAENLTADANIIIERTKTVHQEFDSVARRAQQDLARVESRHPEVEHIAGRLAANYAESALHVPTGENDGADSLTTSKLLSRARSEWKSATQDRQEAQRARDSARLLGAADLLDRCAERTAVAANCLDAILHHDQLLADTAKENGAAFASLEGRAEECRELADQFHTTEASRHAFTAAHQALDDLRLPAAGAGLDDPFQTQASLTALAQALDHFEAGVNGDKLLFEEAGRSIDAAARELATAQELARKARTDQIPDSTQIGETLSSINALEPRLEDLRGRLGVAHEDWDELNQSADALATDASRFAAMLRGELQRAEAAANAINSAARKTRKAARWSGSHGVTIFGSPGSSELERARSFLNAGDYLAAHRAADDARRKANSAIDQAESEVRTKRRAAERRRREQMNSSSSLFSGSRSGFSSGGGRSSFGGGRSSFGGGSSSGSSRSSFSSGSGTSRSGW